MPSDKNRGLVNTQGVDHTINYNNINSVHKAHMTAATQFERLHEKVVLRLQSKEY